MDLFEYFCNNIFSWGVLLLILQPHSVRLVESKNFSEEQELSGFRPQKLNKITVNKSISPIFPKRFNFWTMLEKVNKI